MHRAKLPTQKRVRELFRLNKAKGILLWRNAGGRHKAGDVAQCMGTRYWLVSVDGGLFAVHRIMWLYVYGVVPDYIDHRNRDSLDNRWKNLRAAQSMAWQRANSVGRNGKYKGTYKSLNRWRARAFRNGKGIELGSYVTREEARKAYMKYLRGAFGDFAYTGERK